MYTCLAGLTNLHTNADGSMHDKSKILRIENFRRDSLPLPRRHPELLENRIQEWVVNLLMFLWK